MVEGWNNADACSGKQGESIRSFGGNKVTGTLTCVNVENNLFVTFNVNQNNNVSLHEIRWNFWLSA